MVVRESRARLEADEAVEPRSAARPFLKWAGGKTQLLPKILARLPARIDTFYEPFVGGGAVFFALARQGRFRKATLSDRNPELVHVYQVVKSNVDDLVTELRRLERGHCREQYYEVREQRPRSPVRRAARLLYLNKTGYNGLYRVNRAGQFNVPFGRYERPRIVNEEVLHAASRALSSVQLSVQDFAQACRRARPGDAVYFDPPYLPVSATSNFTAYDSHPFGLEEHARLAEVFAALADRGVCAVLSNSDTRETRALFAAFRSSRVKVARAINSKGAGRGAVSELLVQSLRRQR